MSNKWYTEHLLRPSNEWLKSVGKAFEFNEDKIAGFEAAVDPDVADALEVCEFREKIAEAAHGGLHDLEYLKITYGVPMPPPVEQAFPILSRMESVTKNVSPKSLSQVKELFGVPNRAIAQSDRITELERQMAFENMLRQQVSIPGTPLGERKRARKSTLKSLTRNIFYEYVDEEIILAQPFSLFGDYLKRQREAILDASANTPTFSLPNLIICPGEKVSFKDFGALCFANIIIVGSGEIILESGMKLHAYQIKTVDAGG